jgi:hypothetical protein
VKWGKYETASIIEYSGYDGSEAATSKFVLYGKRFAMLYGNYIRSPPKKKLT